MAERDDVPDPSAFGVSAERGFVPDTDPLVSFGAGADRHLRALDDLAADLPALLEEDRLGPRVRGLEAPPRGTFDGLTERELERVYGVGGFLANAYVNGTDTADPETLPAGVAVPLYEAADRLGRTPVLSYDAYVLHNWQAEDPDRPLTPHNLRPVTTFTTLRDEQWFIAIHVAIESAAGPALVAIADAQAGVLADDPDRVRRALRRMEDPLYDAVSVLDRMPEHNSPEVYGRGFRPYLKALTGVEYEGVEALEGPRTFRGGSGAQSSLLPALDGVLGVDHGDNPLVGYLRKVRDDMPPDHRAYVAAIEAGPDVREYVAAADDDALREAYNECVDRLVAFRERHVDIVQRYLVEQLDDETGTGGTPFHEFLGSFTEATRAARL